MKVTILVSWAVICFSSVSFSSSVGKSLIFLQKYGYLDGTPTRSNKFSRLKRETNYSEALKRFQRLYGLNPTGIADKETLLAMDLPRCGVKDPNTSKQTRHKRNAVLNKPLWKKRDLTYTISQYSHHLNRSLVEHEIERAFKEWSKYTDFTFTTSKSQNADIDIRFDGDRFHRDNGVIAYTQVNKDGMSLIHFDDEEKWNFNGKSDRFFWAALHEIGHILGLKHTNVEKSVMRPTSCISFSELQSYDIQAIQELYGLKITHG
ncbi:unnamed protein product [Brassicogethes aeneus]|uniref:Peptidase metallopeptidase domain-containing protein n=1 Tax=Brassicogethes aeneus TaxID=1431903 RepID=A0A9P0FB52_BRAAE|nr:unnamed protein product [Brassicogethes aeneus]